MTELNSVTCGGLRGVSDSFATALWAPDALFEMLRAGVDGVNIHVRAYASQRSVRARFGRPRGPSAALRHAHVRTARLEPMHTSCDLRLDAPASVHLKAWAVATRRDGSCTCS